MHMLTAAIDLTPLITLLFQFLALLVPVLGTLAGAYLVQRFGAKLGAEQKKITQDRLSAVADKMATAVLTNSEHAAVQAVGPMTTGNTQVDAFGNLLIAQAPDLLKAAGIDVNDPHNAGVQAIERMALARIPAAK